MDVINRLLYFRVPNDWGFAKRREYKLINSIFLFLGLISVALIFISLKLQSITAVSTHIVFLLVYITGVTITYKLNLKQIRLYVLYSFKVPVFFYSLIFYYPTNNLFIPYYSPFIILFLVFPVTAALFELSINSHFLITLGLLLLNLILLPYIPGSIIDILPYHYDQTLALIASLIFTLFIIGVITKEIYFKHKIYAENEKLQAEKLNSTLNDLSKSLAKLEAQKLKIEQQSLELTNLNQTKDKLFSIISHDLRGPFNSILGFIDLLRVNNYPKEEQKKILNILFESANNAYTLINNLLAWSRSQMGKINVVPTKVDVNALISESISTYKTISNNKNIKINHKTTEEISIVTDPDILITICRNILSNAIKYTKPKGKIKVKVEKTGQQVDISIKDNGIGMTQDEIATLFTYNLKVSKLGTAKEKGTGLGLHICQEFTQKLQGKIMVESQEEKGSTFHILLPLEIKQHT